MFSTFAKFSLPLLCVVSFTASSHGHHSHGKPMSELEQKAAEGIFDAKEAKDRALSDWDGVWQSVYPYLLDGSLDPVFKKKAGKDGSKSFAEIKEYYRKGYSGKYSEIGIENGVMEFHQGDKVDACKYEYDGFKVLNYASGKKGVRYLFTCKDASSKAPKYVQFSDHIIMPRKSSHFHIFTGDVSQQALFDELENWPTYYPYQLTKEQVVEDMLHH